MLPRAAGVRHSPAGASHRRGIALRRPPSSRSRPSRRGRSTATGRSCSSSASAALAAAAIAAIAWRRHWGGWLVAGRARRRVLRARRPARRAVAPGQRRRVASRARRGRVRRGARLEGPGHGRPAGRHVPQPARARAHRVPGRHLRGASAVVARGRVAYAAAPVALGDGLVRAVLRPHDRRARRCVSVRSRSPRRVETALGIAGLLACLLWLAWRSRDERVRSLRRAAASSGVRVSRRPRRRPPPSGSRCRDGRRGRPRRRRRRAVRRARCGSRGAALQRRARGRRSRRRSARWRSTAALFADDRADDVLFTVTARRRASRARAARDPRQLRRRDLPQRRRRGALDQARFVRVPSTLDAGAGRAAWMRRSAIEGLDGIWMPTVGRLESHRVRGRPRRLPRRPVLLPRGGRRGRPDGRRRADRRRRLPPHRRSSRTSRTSPRSRRPAGSATARGSGEPDAPGSTSTRRARAAPRSPASSGCCASAATSATRLGRRRRRRRCGCSRCPDYTFQPSASGHSLARIDAAVRAPARARGRSAGGGIRQLRRRGRRRRAVRRRGRAHRPRARIPVARRRRRAAGLGRRRRCARAMRASAARRISPRGPRCSPRTGDWVPVDVTPQFAQSPEPRGDRAAQPRERDRGASRLRRGGRPARPGAGGLRRRRPRRRRRGRSTSPGSGRSLRITGIVLLVLLLVLGPFLVDRRGQGGPPPIAPDAGRAGGAHRRRLGRVRRCGGRCRARRAARAHPRASSPQAFETPARRVPRRRMPTAPSSPARTTDAATRTPSGASSTRSAGASRASAGSGGARSRPYR